LVDRYRLYAADSAVLLGEQMSFDAALEAAHDLALAVLAVSCTWVTVETWIVGPGLSGPVTVHPVVTHIGPPDDLDGARRWLRNVRRLALEWPV
jgi:hypothetical protein